MKVLDKITDIMMLLAEVAIGLMMVHVVAEVLSRWFIGKGLEAVNEITAFYYMVAVVYLPLAYITREDGHISAQIFTQGLSIRARTRLEGVIAFFLFLFMAVLTWQTAVEAISMAKIGEIHEAAHGYLWKWPARIYLPVGSSVMAGYALVLSIKKLFGPVPEEENSDTAPQAVE